MERMTESEILEVVQAYRDGKEIESCDRFVANAQWRYVNAPIWNFAKCNYRVKRQPRVIWVNEYPHTGLGGGKCFDNKEDCVRPVKFIEVLDD